MHYSPVALSIETSQLVEQFNDDFLTFKKNVLDALNCNNEKEFLQKVLIFSQSHLTSSVVNKVTCNSDCFVTKYDGKQANGRKEFLECTTVNHDIDDVYDEEVGVEDRDLRCDDGYVVYIDSLVNRSIIQSQFKPCTCCQLIVENMRKNVTSNYNQSTADFKVKVVAV